jgi:hypothetical protein
MNNPFIKISSNDWKTIILYAETAYDMHSTEIGGMAHAFKENGVWTIKNPVILNQKISPANCTLDKEALATYYSESVKDYNKEDLTADKFLYVWWHSHHTMEAFWSATDQGTIKDAAKNGPSMSLVVNLKGEYKLTYTFNEPIEAYINCDLKIITDKENPLRKEIKEKCKVQLSTKSTITPTLFDNEKTISPSFDFQENLFLENPNYGMADTYIDDNEIVGALYDDKRTYMIQESSNDINDTIIDYMSESINYSAFKTLIENINDKYAVYGIDYKIPSKKDIASSSAQELLKQENNKEVN